MTRFEFSTKFEEAIIKITKSKKTMGIEEMILQRAEEKGKKKDVMKGLYAK